MRTPKTAEEDKSIWKAVSEQTFYKKVDELEKQHVDYVEHYFRPPTDSPISPDLLPFEEERQLADDFAFIAACEFGVPFITAATIEVLPGLSGLTVRLAANEGVADRVVTAFEAIFASLMQCANKSVSRSVCEEHIFHQIVSLNTNRILGRLDSRWYKRRLGFRYGKGPPTTQLLDTITQSGRGRFAYSPSYIDISKQAAQLDKEFLDLEQSLDRPKVDKVQSIVKKAFALTRDGISLTSRLVELGLPSNRNSDRQISKVANYWHISVKLVRFCRYRSYRSLFSNLIVERIEKFDGHQIPKQQLQRFVHAEIQLIAHYETSSNRLPRVIGSSKHACFLCNAFIQAHGTFYVSKTHGQCYEQWYIPDLAEYSDKTIKRFRATIVAVYRTVIKETSRIRMIRELRLPIRETTNQSSLNFERLMLTSPSITTVSSHSTEASDRTIRKAPVALGRDSHANRVLTETARNIVQALHEASQPKDEVDGPTPTVKPSEAVAAHPQPLSPIPSQERPNPEDNNLNTFESRDHAATASPRPLNDENSTREAHVPVSPELDLQDQRQEYVPEPEGERTPKATSPLFRCSPNPSAPLSPQPSPRATQQQTILNPSSSPTCLDISDWLRLYATISSPPPPESIQDTSSAINTRSAPRGLITIEPLDLSGEILGASVEEQVADISALRPGEKVTLRRSGSDELDELDDTIKGKGKGKVKAKEMNLILVGDRGQRVRVVCEWLDA